MSRSKDIVIAGLAVSSAALVLLAWRQHGEIRRIEALVLERPIAGVSAIALHAGTGQTYVVGSRPSAAGDATGGAALTPGTDATGSPSPDRGTPLSRRRGSSSLVRLMENPEFVQALGQQRHATLDQRFAALFRLLDLNGDELARFKSLLVEKENVVLDVVAVSDTMPGGPLSRESLRASVSAAQAQVDQAIQSSLGNERYAIYRDYERTLAKRATVAQLEQRLSYTGTPLTPTQADSLVRILAAHAPAPTMESVPALTVILRAGVPEAAPILPTNAATGHLTDDMVMQAQLVLAPAQLPALREIQAEQNAGVRASQIIREVIPGGDAGPIALPFYLH